MIESLRKIFIVLLILRNLTFFGPVFSVSNSLPTSVSLTFSISGNYFDPFLKPVVQFILQSTLSLFLIFVLQLSLYIQWNSFLINLIYHCLHLILAMLFNDCLSKTQFIVSFFRIVVHEFWPVKQTSDLTMRFLR